MRCHTNLRCANLSGAILADVNLSGNELSGAILINTNLSGKNLRGADLCGAKLRGVNLSSADLCEANLSSTDLSNAILHNTNLSGTNINGANLRNANLIDANLIGAHLRGSDLKWANLSGAILSRTNLRNANLSGANLTDVNLRGNELSDIILIDVDLSGKNLRGANLCGADLSSTNLCDSDLCTANLSSANLSGANLCRTKLSGANLSGTDLSGLGLSDIDLSGTNLSGTDLSGKNLRNTNLSGANLSSTDLSGTDLRATNLSGANINGANLSYANLRKADLIGAYLSGANLHEADLRDADLENIDLRGISLKNTQLDNALLTIYSLSGTDLHDINLKKVSIKLLPAEVSWNDRNVDRLLNHHNNAGGSLLTTLRSIDDRHKNLKVQLAHELTHSLSGAGYTPARLTPVALPILEILGQPPYTDDSVLVAWLGSVAEARLTERGTEGMTPAITGSLLFPFEREPRLAMRQSAGLIQLVHAALDGGDPALAGRAEVLYARYLALPKIALYTRSALFDRLNPDAPDEPARVSLAERDEINLVLLPATPGGPVMLLSRDALDGMLHPDPAQPAWDHFCLMETPERACPVAAINPELLFRQDFPLFLSPFLAEQNKSAFARLLDTLDLKDYRADFDAALRSRSSSQKLISAQVQTELHALFSHAMRPDESWGRLTAEHAARILHVFTLKEASRREQAQHFLCLSALFARLSSSWYFGTEYESPVTLRVYAHALMLEAAELDSSAITTEQLHDWQNRFQKRSGAFDCTAVLSDIMISHVRQTCPAVLAGIRPASWT